MLIVEIIVLLFRDQNAYSLVYDSTNKPEVIKRQAKEHLEAALKKDAQRKQAFTSVVIALHLIPMLV